MHRATPDVNGARGSRSTPFLPPSGPAQRLFQGPSAKSKFLAAPTSTGSTVPGIRRIPIRTASTKARHGNPRKSPSATAASSFWTTPDRPITQYPKKPLPKTILGRRPPEELECFTAKTPRSPSWIGFRAHSTFLGALGVLAVNFKVPRIATHGPRVLVLDTEIGTTEYSEHTERERVRIENSNTRWMNRRLFATDSFSVYSVVVHLPF